MMTKHRPLVRCLQFLALMLSAGAALTACSDRVAADASGAAVAASAKAPDYTELIEAIPPLAPKSEVETSAEFATRKRQRLAHLAGMRMLFTVPVSLGKCKITVEDDVGSTRNYVGLRYDADREQLEVCALDEAAIPPSGLRRRYGMLITQSDTKEEFSKGTNLLGAEVEITTRITNGKAIFVDVPTSSVHDFAHTRIPMKVSAAKDLLANGGRLVYDVVLDPGSSGEVMTSSIKTRATMTKPQGIHETITGVPVKVRSIALESSTGAVVARFDLATDATLGPGLALIPDSDSQTGAGESTRTRYGVLRMGEGGAYLDGHKVFSRGLGGGLHAVALRQMGQHDVVVTEEESGGSAGYVDIVLLDIATDRTVKVLHGEYAEFQGLTDPASQIRKVGDTLVLDLGFVAGKHRKGVFDGKILSTVLETVGPTAIPDLLCRQVHSVVEACASRHSPGNECDETFEKLSHAEKGGIYNAFAYPAQIEERFKQSCDDACTSGGAPVFAQTKRELCGASLP